MKGSLIIFTLLTTFAASSMSAESLTTSQDPIMVNSQESQQGQVLSNSTKQNRHAVPTKGLSKHQLKQKAAPMTRPLVGESRSTSPDFWIYDAFVSFNIDSDYDGYYSTFTVEFDADTYFDSAEVYARLYLSRGDVFQEYHTSSLFYIYADSSSDSLVIESDLITGFPSGDYELLIELYDARTDDLVAVYDGYNDADLTLLTLESRSYEESTVVVTTEYGGSFGILMLLLAPVALLRRKLA